MFDGFEAAKEMGSTPFELTDEQKEEFKDAADDLFSVAEKHDIPLLILATLGNEDTGDSMRMETALMAHIDSRKASPPLTLFASALGREEALGSAPIYIKVLSACVILALKEDGAYESFRVMEALMPILKPYVEEEAEKRKNKKPSGMSRKAFESFKDLMEKIGFEVGDDDEEDDSEDD